MTTDRRPIQELDLLAYIDGLLEPARRAEVEAHLALHPEEAAWVADCLKQNELIHELYGGPHREPLPQPLRRTLFGDGEAAVRPPPVASRARRMAAAVALLVCGGVAGWGLAESERPAPGTEVARAFLSDMAAAHAAGVRAAVDGPPGFELAVGSDLPSLGGLTVEKAAPAADAATPDLSAQGLALVSRRTVRGPDGRPAVQLIYEDIGGRLVSVYLGSGPPKQGPEFRVAERSGLAVVYWLTGPFVYGVVGNLPKAEIAEIARAVDRSLRADAAVGAGVPSPVPATGGGNTALAPLAPPVPAVPDVKGGGATATEM